MKGLEKAATLLLTIGEELAAEVLKHLKQPEIQRVTTRMVKLDDLKNDVVDSMTKDFIQTVREHSVVGMDGSQYMQNILAKTVGPEKASEMMENLLLRSSEGGLEAIRMMEPRMIADVVKREHPQVIAFVLASLDSNKAGQALQHLAESLQSEVIYRISTMKDIHPSMLGEVEAAFKTHVSESTSRGFSLGGVKFVADLLNRMETSAERRILDEIRKMEEGLSQKIEEQLFVFEDIGTFDDKTLQTILKEVTSDILVVALRGADDSLKENFFRNMSERAAVIIKEEMDMRGQVRLKDVEKAQQELLRVVKALEEAGKIQIPGKSGDEVYV